MKPLRNPDVQSKLLPDGHIVLFSAQHEWAHTLTPLAGIAWEFCDGENSVDDIVGLISDTAGIPSNEIPQLAELFDELKNSGLLVLS